MEGCVSTIIETGNHHLDGAFIMDSLSSFSLFTTDMFIRANLQFYAQHKAGDELTPTPWAVLLVIPVNPSNPPIFWT